MAARVEPPILELATAMLLERDKPWYVERLPLVKDRVRGRLGPLSVLDEYPNLAAYVARGEARPAYKRAFDAQLAVNTGKPSTN
jgi:glutathione S-transferase